MNEIDAEEFDTLAQILEGEQQSHKRRRSLCMSMFVTFFVLFILALLLLGLHMAGVVAAEQQQDGLLSQLSFVSTLGTLGTAVSRPLASGGRRRTASTRSSVRCWRRARASNACSSRYSGKSNARMKRNAGFCWT